MSKKIMLNGVDYTGVYSIKGNAESAYRTGDVNITPANIGLGNVNNTADSEKSVKYATSAGSASSASKATGVVDYGATGKTIQIGYSGSGIQGSDIKFIAGYTNGNNADVNAKIKDVSKNALKSWLGLGSLAYSSATIPTIPSSLPANGGNSATVNGHTVNSNVPANAKFTDTVYNDTKIQNDINTLKKSVSDGKTKVANAITGKGVKTATDATFDVMAENISKIDTELHGATLSVVTSDKELFGKTVTLTLKDGSTGSQRKTVFSSNGKCSFVVQKPGSYTVACGDDANEDVTVTGDDVLNKTTMVVSLVLIKIVTFASGTDAEIERMIQAHYNNKINITDYWSVGDTRTVNLIESSSGNEFHRKQSVEFVIGDFDHDDLTTPINGHTKAAVTLLQKDCLMDEGNVSNPTANGSTNTENGSMNSGQTNEGGWHSCNRRRWCNDAYFYMIPLTFQSMIKTVNKKVSVGNLLSTIETVQDRVFLAAEIEIFGSTTYSCEGEGTQYQYYKNATANRYKRPRWGGNYVSDVYWERSPYKNNNTSFCVVAADGSANTRFADSTFGIAPCVCI